MCYNVIFGRILFYDEVISGILSVDLANFVKLNCKIVKDPKFLIVFLFDPIFNVSINICEINK